MFDTVSWKAALAFIQAVTCCAQAVVFLYNWIHPPAIHLESCGHMGPPSRSRPSHLLPPPLCMLCCPLLHVHQRQSCTTHACGLNVCTTNINISTLTVASAVSGTPELCCPILLLHAGVAEIGISYEKLAQSVSPGNMIKIADGGLSVQVTEVLDAKRVRGM